MFFDPSGTLDVSTEPSDLKETDMQRCKNLVLDQSGELFTRDGHSKINASAIDTDISEIIVQDGDRYSFSGDEIYLNEVSIWP